MLNRATWDLDPREFIFLELSNHGRMRLAETNFVERKDTQNFLEKDPSTTKEIVDKLLIKLKFQQRDMLIDLEDGATRLTMIIDNVYLVFSYTKGFRNGYGSKQIGKIILITAIPVEEINKSEGRTVENFKMLTTLVRGNAGSRIGVVKHLKNRYALKRNQIKEYSKKKKALKNEMLG